MKKLKIGDCVCGRLNQPGTGVYYEIVGIKFNLWRWSTSYELVGKSWETKAKLSGYRDGYTVWFEHKFVERDMQQCWPENQE